MNEIYESLEGKTAYGDLLKQMGERFCGLALNSILLELFRKRVTGIGPGDLLENF